MIRSAFVATLSVIAIQAISHASSANSVTFRINRLSNNAGVSGIHAVGVQAGIALEMVRTVACLATVRTVQAISFILASVEVSIATGDALISLQAISVHAHEAVLNVWSIAEKTVLNTVSDEHIFIVEVKSFSVRGKSQTFCSWNMLVVIGVTQLAVVERRTAAVFAVVNTGLASHVLLICVREFWAFNAEYPVYHLSFSIADFALIAL